MLIPRFGGIEQNVSDLRGLQGFVGGLDRRFARSLVNDAEGTAKGDAGDFPDAGNGGPCISLWGQKSLGKSAIYRQRIGPMHIARRFTKPGQSAYAEIEFRKALSEIRNPDGSVVFRLDNIDVPAQFSQVAADILAQKYFRKAVVPA